VHVLLIACLTLFLSNHDSSVTSAPAPLTFEQFKKNYVKSQLYYKRRINRNIYYPKNQPASSFIKLPMDYSRYDLNSDGFVTALELADATGTNLEDCRLPFKNADKNDDGLLTKEEIKDAPWVFDIESYRREFHDRRYNMYP